jgi:putative nucleotidyltransferase with HDIG domain
VAIVLKVGPAATTLRSRLDVARSLTLLRVFLVASAAILLLAATILGAVLSTTIKHQAIDLRRDELSRYVDSVLGDQLVRGDHIAIGPKQASLLDRVVRRQHDLLSVKVWRADGTLAWTNVGRYRIGKRFELEDDLGKTIHENRATGAIDDLSANGENALEKRLIGRGHVLEVYAPIDARGHAGAIGAYEIYAKPQGVEGAISSRRKLIWLTVGAVFAALWVALALLVRGASRTLRRQTATLRQRSRELLDSYRRQEELSLEAIESLNATVEAKDPYTAGHSRRVQELSLALGEALGLARAQLDGLRYGALFHDIGKLAVPDAILTKPERLTAEEFELIKRHSAEGARIVGKFGRLRDAVPVIRHHHERWSGGGYPEGISGAEIPLEAAIVGLADAWDAMTTDRPYHRALSFDEAADELRLGRGTQFAPAVVDAFFAVMSRRDVPAAVQIAS